MKKKLTLLALALTLGSTSVAEATSYIEYYRDNLFLGIAYHRVGCLTDGLTIQSNQEYDGFTTKNYCYVGNSWNQVPDADWFAWSTGTESQANTCGDQANDYYGTPNYASSSNTCDYNIMTDCNSDCWIKNFSTCMGYTVQIASPCWPDYQEEECDPWEDQFCYDDTNA